MDAPSLTNPLINTSWLWPTNQLKFHQTVWSMINTFKVAFLHFIQKGLIISKEYNIFIFISIVTCHSSSSILTLIWINLIFFVCWKYFSCSFSSNQIAKLLSKMTVPISTATKIVGELSLFFALQYRYCHSFSSIWWVWKAMLLYFEFLS